MDMPGADPARVERQLYNLDLLPDTMGGDVQFVRTSAAKGTGIAELLETLSLVAELKELKANPHKPAQGTCLEAYLSGDEGVMATLLVQQGTLHRGDVIVCGATFGRVRAMYDDLGRPIQEAGPSRARADHRPRRGAERRRPLPRGHRTGESPRDRREADVPSAGRGAGHASRPVTLDKLGAVKTAKIAELKVILKAEARGSVEAIRKELEKLIHDEVRVRVLHAGIGAITESDVQLALASPEDSMVVGFNVVPDDAALRLAEERDIPIREYNIIYKLTEDIKAALEGKLKPEERVIHLGRAVVRQTFKISKVGTAAGCYVTQGVIERSAKIRVIRDGAVIYPQAEKVASLESLKRFKDDVERGQGGLRLRHEDRGLRRHQGRRRDRGVPNRAGATDPVTSPQFSVPSPQSHRTADWGRRTGDFSMHVGSLRVRLLAPPVAELERQAAGRPQRDRAAEELVQRGSCRGRRPR